MTGATSGGLKLRCIATTYLSSYFYEASTTLKIVICYVIRGLTEHNSQCTVIAVALFDLGPLHGLQLTINVQRYENLPFSDEDSGIKASRSYTIKNH